MGIFNFLEFKDVQKDEIDYYQAIKTTKIINKKVQSSIIESIKLVCSDYATKLIIQNIETSKLSDYIVQDLDNEIKLTSKNSSYTVTGNLTKCSCDEFFDLLLPSKHVFFCRNLKNQTIFVEV